MGNENNTLVNIGRGRLCAFQPRSKTRALKYREKRLCQILKRPSHLLTANVTELDLHVCLGTSYG
jgi:hypothetical protein